MHKHLVGMPIRRKYVYTFISILMVVRFAALQLMYVELTLMEQLGIAFFGFLFSIFLFEVIDAINTRLNQYLPYEQGVIRRLIAQILICVVFAFSLHTIILLLLADSLPAPVNRLTLMASYVIYFILIIAINVSYFGAYFFEQWKVKLLEAERLATEKALAQRERAQVQYDNLKNQLNPHFLFNSLASLHSLIFENQELASQFLQQLSKVYRYVLENKEKELVSLQTEVKFVQHYLMLLKTRFGDGLLTEIRIEPGKEGKQIVPVALQILIENALKHNVIGEDTPLKICIRTQGDFLRVTNNLQKKSIVEHSNKTGLENMKTLYTYLSPLPVEIREDEREFCVKIPLL